MFILYYYITFILSLILLFVYIWKRNKQFNVCYTIINTVIPVTNLGYLFIATSSTAEEALVANKVAYFGICFLLPLFLISIMNSCKIEIKKWIIALMFIFNVSLYALVIEVGQRKIYYKSVELEKMDGVAILHKTYGPAHILFYVVLAMYGIVSISILTYSLMKKKRQVSSKVLTLQLLCVIVFGAIFILERNTTFKLAFTPAGYVFTQFIYILIINIIYLYDIDYMSVDSHTKNVDIGFVSVDKRMRYLGSNHIAKLYFEELRYLYVDRQIHKDTEFLSNIYDWVWEIREREGTITKMVQRDKKIFKVTAGYLVDNRKKRGYQFIIEDDTKEQRYINNINNYNENLQEEVEKKTKSVREMQDKLILGMADMVEDRDNSTGGHIKRTSQVIRILMDEIMKDNTMKFDRTFYEYMIKAAPMHDLGKIAVDDVILRKPGRFTDEEYEIMKSHAEKGAQIVRRILDGIEDPYFAKIAENVAHYHHERYDGTGYPEHLKGDEIPIEARIMAIADVYDALVSKRCYKDKISFDDAFRIIEDGMGKDFDPMFNIYFIRCKKRLEEYYMSFAG